MNHSRKRSVLLMGQTPPPWHGQAVATQILFEHDWPGFDVQRLRMEFSEEMLEVGRFQWKKIRHLFHLIRAARRILKRTPECILFYPPASAKWIPFLRDMAFLLCVRHLAGSTVFIFHASGLPVFVESGWIRRWLGRLAYGGVDVALEVAQESVAPHVVFGAKAWQWCPCAIQMPEMARKVAVQGEPLTVLYVGSLQEGKGLLEILKTAAILKRQGRAQDFRFRIVGKWFSREFEADVRHLQDEFELGGMVEFAGQLTGDEKWRAYAEADVFFFPTHYEAEATPIVLMEALGAGLPIVSTIWAGIPAMLDGCQSARLLPVHAPDQYASAFIDIFSRRVENCEVEEASRAFYRDRFLPERFIERVEKAFGLALRPGMSLVCDLGNDGASRNQTAIAPVRVQAYLADQNPGYDRSFGISRMSHVVLGALQAGGQIKVNAVISKTSQQAPASVDAVCVLPWGTRGKWVRLLTDHFHPLFGSHHPVVDFHYFPKGYLPLLAGLCKPSVVTIHDTIIQYDEDHYPKWRRAWEYRYWAMMLKHTLHKADRIMTVSESSKQQIHRFMDRHGIPPQEIVVTYEPCMYEQIPQPEAPVKEDYVIHLASCEPHKRTAHLIRWWHEAELQGRTLPALHLIGSTPPEVMPLVASSQRILKRPFLEDSALQAAYLGARALILPSEIEGFGLPALEAYFLGTPVCFVRGTSVEEVLGVATSKGGFDLINSTSLFVALDEVMQMSAEDVRHCGLQLRSTYAAERVAEKMVAVFQEVRSRR